MKSLFDENAYQEIVQRLQSLSDNQTRQWGKMDVAQMLHHCQQPLNIALGRKKIKKQFFPLASLFKKSLYIDKPWRKNLPTVSSFKVGEQKDFQTEKEKLLELTEVFHHKKEERKWAPHPVFGKFSPEQWGQMQYKHLDHHLRQFGA